MNTTPTMTAEALRGFGTTFDLTTGRMRNWYVGADGVQRWVDNDQRVDAREALLDARQSAGGA